MTLRSNDATYIRELLSPPKRIAMVGASDTPGRPSNNVFQYLTSLGHTVVPVNPVTESVCGVPTVPDLAGAAQLGAIDFVDVFRRPEQVGEVVEAAIAVGAPAIWFQLGVINEAAIQAAVAAGLEVVVDRCPAIEGPRLL